MKHWEYYSLCFSVDTNMIAKFNQLGNDGWELVSMVAGTDCFIRAVFKRPKD